MRSYKIEQFTDDLIVWHGDIEYMIVERRFNWKGQMVSSFMMGNECVLKTTYSVFLFMKFILIKKQHLSVVVSLLKEKRRYVLSVNGGRFYTVIHYFKNPMYTLWDSNRKIGEVHTKMIDFGLSSKIYDVFFDNDEEGNDLYSLLILLMNFPDRMSV